MNLALKIASMVVTAGALAGAVAIGGGVPLSPAEIADATEMAAANSKTAVRNTSEAERDTRALATIARNVDRQLATSRRMLDIQLQIEATSESMNSRTVDLAGAIEAIEEELSALERDVAALANLAGRTAGYADDSVAAARTLRETLAVLMERFDEVVAESRELNRKARGYQKLRSRP